MEVKKTMLILAPVTSRSGYGDHARDVVLSFYDLDKFDIKIIDCNWGNTPRTALDDETDEKLSLIKSLIHINTNTHAFPTQPDVYVDIRIPNEFQQIGKFNIGITAGIETNAISQKWIECCNKMDLVIVPSEHSKMGIVHSVYEMNKNLPDGTQEKVGELKVEKPVEVLFEGAREAYKPIHHKEINTEFFDWLNNEVPEKFAFLMVGLWGKGAFGEDRKDIGRLVKVFFETFANRKKQPALILKTNGATFSILDKADCRQKIEHIKSMFPADVKLPNVYMLHGDLTTKEMNYLYNHPKVKCMVSLTHGEGFGRPLLEATMTGIPVIAPAYSGQLDFLNKDESILLGGDMNKIPKSAVWEDILIPESQWITVEENNARSALDYMYNNHGEWKSNANKLMIKNRKKFTRENMTKELDKILDEHLKFEVKVNLPKLKKVEG